MNQIQEFLQSENWLAFQGVTGKETVPFSFDDFTANGIIHTLPLIGKYLYVPKGPILENVKVQMPNFKKNLNDFIFLAKEKNVKWIRIEPESEESLLEIREAFDGRIVRAHDIQPREIFVMDITKDTETLLAQMKSKTRYNIRLAEKHGVKVFATREEKYKQAFFDLITATADRKEIKSYPRSYYEKFFEMFPPEMCQLFVAEYDGEVLAANILIIFGERAIYLHGGSSNAHREVMAPYLLQWGQILYAKERSCTEYDFGGVKTLNQGKEKNNWGGITKFKRGFSPETAPILFPGSYDMVLDSKAYYLYTFIRHTREIIHSFNIFK